MLRLLTISNYALIGKTEITFNPGFSVITGETGAGKSIMLGALTMILGDRADYSLILDKSKKCIIEGEFQLSDGFLKKLFLDEELDYSETCILRRELSPNGTSRSFVNDTPVSLQIMRRIGLSLVDIHSQHENLMLNQDSFQLAVLDALAVNGKTLEKYSALYREFRENEKKLNDILVQIQKANADHEYSLFQFEQLDAANLREDEQEKLEDEIALLTNASDIIAQFNSALRVLDGDGSSMLEQGREVKNSLTQAARKYGAVESLNARFESILIELRDVKSEVENVLHGLELNPDRLKSLEERLDLIYSLQQKHRTDNIKALLQLKEDFYLKTISVSKLDDEKRKTEEEIVKQRSALNELSKKLRDARIKKAAPLSEKMATMLKQLGIPNAIFKVEVKALDEFLPAGSDKVTFLFSANPNSPVGDLGKIASGGEMSRLMLSLKSLIQSNSAVPTLIFDEIDAGVSGEIADRMGRMLEGLSHHCQVIAITHLPQIASQGKSHYLVHKTYQNEVASTNITSLSEKDRVEEIAKMISGEKVTSAAKEQAKALLKTK